MSTNTKAQIVQKLRALRETMINVATDMDDYGGFIESNTAIAIRILAVAAERLTTALENGHD